MYSSYMQIPIVAYTAHLLYAFFGWTQGTYNVNIGIKPSDQNHVVSYRVSVCLLHHIYSIGFFRSVGKYG